MTWWRVPRNTSTSTWATLDQVEASADSAGYISSGDMCQRLFMEALTRGIGVNGKICNAVLSGFGSDLEVRVKHGNGVNGANGMKTFTLEQDRHLSFYLPEPYSDRH